VLGIFVLGQDDALVWVESFRKTVDINKLIS
jgi:hypothetical protein